MPNFKKRYGAGMHRNSVDAALGSLKINFLIEKNKEWNIWKVYLKSKGNNFHSRKYLNKVLLTSFKHTLD